MTLPSIRDSASHTSAVNEVFRAVMPTLVEEGDLLVVRYSGDSTASPLQVLTGDFQGWNLMNSTNVSNTLAAGHMWKIAAGTEGGLTLFTASSPSEKWCVSTLALADVDVLTGGGVSNNAFNTGSANPDPAALAAIVGDMFYHASLGGEGSTATTADPAGYTNVHNLNSAAADGASLRVAYKATDVSPENPGAWTRASTAWVSTVAGYRGVDPTAPRYQRLVNRKTEVLSGGTKNYSVTIPTGAERRFFALLHAASSTVSAITLDPGGPQELELVPVRRADGTTAEAVAAGTARAAAWYEAFPVPPAGTYTLRVQTSVTGDCAMLSATIPNSEQEPIVYDVLNASGSGAAASGNLSVPDFGLVVAGCVQPLVTQPTGTPSSFVWSALTGFAQQSSWTTPHYCTMTARRLTPGLSSVALSANALSVGSVQSFSAFAVRYFDGDNAPKWGTEF